MKKYCTKCGKPFEAVGREVICPACKQAAAEDAKRAAVLKAKRASWNGESVPVRISGRASTLIRRYGAANNLPFAQALDALLQVSAFFKSTGKAWEDITPYKSHRRDKATSTPHDEQADSKQADSKQADSKQADSKQADSKQADKSQEVKQVVKGTSKKVANKTSKA